MRRARDELCEARCGRAKVLRVVEDEEELARTDRVDECLERLSRRVFDAEGLGDGRNE
jgi:hypothetical protein